MATSEERMRLLKMVEEGKLSPEEAAKLLTLLTESANSRKSAAASGVPSDTAGFVPPTMRARNIRIRVADTRPGRRSANVNLTLPIGLVGVLVKVAERFIPPEERERINANEIWHAIHSGATGKIVDVVGDDGERVEIILE